MLNKSNRKGIRSNLMTNIEKLIIDSVLASASLNLLRELKTEQILDDDKRKYVNSDIELNVYYKSNDFCISNIKFIEILGDNEQNYNLGISKDGAGVDFNEKPHPVFYLGNLKNWYHSDTCPDKDILTFYSCLYKYYNIVTCNIDKDIRQYIIHGIYKEYLSIKNKLSEPNC
jgi:hypothetical protein